MATVQTFNNNQDEDKNQSITGAPPQTGGSAAAPSTGSSSAAPTAGAPKASSSGRFTNLNAYLNANKGYKQEQGGLAGQITDNLGGKANKIENNYNQSNKQFQTDANGNRIQYDGDLVNKAINDSSNFVGDQKNVDAFTKLRDATYKGPENLANAGQLQNQAQGFQSTANLSQTEGGRYALLNKLYGNATYNKGQQSLDNLLLQGNSQQLQKLNTVNPMASNLNTEINNGIQSAQGLAGQYKNEAQDAQSQTRNALTGAVTGFDTNAQAAVDKGNADRQAAYQSSLSNLSQGKISAADAAKFGLTGASGVNLYNLDPTKYLTQSNTTATKQNVLDSNQFAQIQALQKLSGNALSGDVTGKLATYNDPSQAGVFAKSDPYTFDTARFQNDSRAGDAAYNAARNNATVQTGGASAQYNTINKQQQFINDRLAAQGVSDVSQLKGTSGDDARYYQDLINKFNAAQGANKKLQTV